MKMNEMEMNLEEMEMVNGGSFLDDVAEGFKKIKDTIEDYIRSIPKPVIAKAAE